MKKNHIYPTDLTDIQWNGIKDVIPPAKLGGRPRTLCMRVVINAILYVTVTGCQWRMVPSDYPKWQRVYAYFQTFRDDGTSKRVVDTLRAQVRQRAGRHKHPTAGTLNSQSVKTSARTGAHGYDAGKKVSGRKRHILVDTMGLLLALVVIAASISDAAGTKQLLLRLGGACKKLRRIWVDGAYRGHLFEWVLLHCRFLLQSLLRSDDQKGFAVLPRRWVVERSFAWNTQCHSLSKDYETFSESSEAMTHIAMTRLMIQCLAQT